MIGQLTIREPIYPSEVLTVSVERKVYIGWKGVEVQHHGGHAGDNDAARMRE